MQPSRIPTGERNAKATSKSHAVPLPGGQFTGEGQIDNLSKPVMFREIAFHRVAVNTGLVAYINDPRRDVARPLDGVEHAILRPGFRLAHSQSR